MSERSHVNMHRLSRWGIRPRGGWLATLGAAIAALGVAAAGAQTTATGQVQVAVAANFSAPMREIAQAFERDTGHRAVLAFGSTGAFYAQIRNGAPFDVLLAADERTPSRIASDGLSVPGTQFTYAVGRLALWSTDASLIDPRADVLRGPAVRRLAMANPKLAPYGLAAQQTLQNMGLWEAWQPRLVQGENIAQAHQFVASGNAQAGFVAWSQVQVDGVVRSGSAWAVPPDMHDPIRQDAIVLVRARDNPAAQALVDYLRSETARQIITRFGYGF